MREMRREGRGGKGGVAGSVSRGGEEGVSEGRYGEITTLWERREDEGRHNSGNLMMLNNAPSFH